MTCSHRLCRGTACRPLTGVGQALPYTVDARIPNPCIRAADPKPGGLRYQMLIVGRVAQRYAWSAFLCGFSIPRRGCSRQVIKNQRFETTKRRSPEMRAIIILGTAYRNQNSRPSREKNRRGGQKAPTFALPAQWIKDINARNAKNAPDSLRKSITFAAADGVTDRPAGQTRSKTASAFAGKTAISVPATITKTESAAIPGVGVLRSVPLVGGTVWVVARPVSMR